MHRMTVCADFYVLFSGHHIPNARGPLLTGGGKKPAVAAKRDIGASSLVLVDHLKQFVTANQVELVVPI